MKLVFYPQAQKELQKLGSVAEVKVTDKLNAYAANPAAFRQQVKKLRGMDAWRLRVGDYRVIFNEDGVVLMVIQVAHRREIYR